MGGGRSRRGLTTFAGSGGSFGSGGSSGMSHAVSTSIVTRLTGFFEGRREVMSDQFTAEPGRLRSSVRNHAIRRAAEHDVDLARRSLNRSTRRASRVCRSTFVSSKRRGGQLAFARERETADGVERGLEVLCGLRRVVGGYDRGFARTACLRDRVEVRRIADADDERRDPRRHRSRLVRDRLNRAVAGVGLAIGDEHDGRLFPPGSR